MPDFKTGLKMPNCRHALRLEGVRINGFERTPTAAFGLPQYHFCASNPRLMFKNFSPKMLGVSGRQSELIELALTYRFKGMDLYYEDFAKRVNTGSIDEAARFILSAKKRVEDFRIGAWNLPIRWNGADAAYRTDLATLDAHCQAAMAVDATTARLYIEASNDELPFVDMFQRQQSRLQEIAEKLSAHGMKVAIGFDAAPASVAKGEHAFIHKAEAFAEFITGVGADNVGMLFDTWHWYVGEGGKDQMQDLDPKSIFIVQIADVPADAKLTEIAANDRILPGSENGSIDANGVMDWLVEKEFEGPVTPAPSAKMFKGMTRDSIVQQAANCLADLWNAAGIVVEEEEMLFPGQEEEAVEETTDDDSDSENSDSEGETAKADDAEKVASDE